jgi:hypothetical protein
MRITLGTTGAPPAHPATTPKSERKISEHHATIRIRVASGAKAETRRGIAAPAAKLPFIKSHGCDENDNNAI